MTKSAIVITVTAALLYTGLPGGPTIDSTTTGVDKLSTSVVTDIPNPESVRHIPELAWHAWRASSHDPHDCSTICWDQHEANVHIAPDVGPGNGLNEVGGGAHTWLWEGLCAEKHPACRSQNDMMGAIDRAVRDGNATRLRSILNDEADGAFAHIAWERNAIQVLDCTESGELLAHIPVPSDLLTMLEAEEQ